VPEPWRGYTLRALDARKRFRELAQGVPPGPVARELDNALSGVEAVVREQWVLSRGGAALAGPPGRAAKAARQLEAAQAALAKAGGADRAVLQSRESALASELRSARRLDAVTSQASERLATLCAQLEGLVATAGELVLSAGSGGGEVGPLSQELSALNQGLDEVRRMLPAAGDAQANGLS
jgi:hypothetical protein